MAKWVTAAAGIVILAVGIGGWFWGKRGDPLSPMGRKVGFLRKELGMEVVGFLPTWMVGKTEDYCEELTHLVFLGIEVEEDGSLVWDYQAKKVNSEEYQRLKDKFKQCGGKNILGIKLFDDKKLGLFLGDNEARARLIEELRVVVMDFDGVNVDFEFMGDPLEVLGERMAGFLEEMRGAGVGEISVDVFANTVIKGSKEQLDALMGRVDRLIVMGYDFHRSGSQYAGAVAPVNSGAGERNLGEVMRKIVEAGLERKKMVVAYPLYGYEWVTVDESLGSRVEDYVAMWSIRRIEDSRDKLGEKSGFKENWDELSMTPWASWRETVKKSRVESYKVGTRWRRRTVYYTEEEIHEVYFENGASLGIKLGLVRETGLAGVGFWALGYEPKSLLKEILK